MIAEPAECPRCGGSGVVSAWTTPPTPGAEGVLEQFRCPACDGDGLADPEDLESPDDE